jgi:hypothetical protein
MYSATLGRLFFLVVTRRVSMDGSLRPGAPLNTVAGSRGDCDRGALSNEQRRVCAQSQLRRRTAEVASGEEKTRTLTELTISCDASSSKCPIRDMLSMDVRERGAAGHTNRSCTALAGGPVMAARAGGAPPNRAPWTRLILHERGDDDECTPARRRSVRVCARGAREGHARPSKRHPRANEHHTRASTFACAG